MPPVYTCEHMRLIRLYLWMTFALRWFRRGWRAAWCRRWTAGRRLKWRWRWAWSVWWLRVSSARMPSCAVGQRSSPRRRLFRCPVARSRIFWTPRRQTVASRPPAASWRSRPDLSAPAPPASPTASVRRNRNNSLKRFTSTLISWPRKPYHFFKPSYSSIALYV